MSRGPDRAQISVYMPKALADTIEALAKKEKRTVSQMGRILWEESLEARGIIFAVEEEDEESACALA